MSDILAISASGMSHSDRWLQVSANNVANLNSEGFRASRVLAREQAGGGVTTVVTRTADPPVLAFDGSLYHELSNVSLETETVNQLQALRAYEANAKVLETTNDMYGSVLDLFI